MVKPLYPLSVAKRQPCAAHWPRGLSSTWPEAQTSQVGRSSTWPKRPQPRVQKRAQVGGGGLDRRRVQERAQVGGGGLVML